MPPRAQLTTRTPFFILANAAGPTRPRVSGVSGVCTVMKSARSYSSSSPTNSMPMRWATSVEMNGSYAITRIFSPRARSTTRAADVADADDAKGLIEHFGAGEPAFLPLCPTSSTRWPAGWSEPTTTRG